MGLAQPQLVLAAGCGLRFIVELYAGKSAVRLENVQCVGDLSRVRGQRIFQYTAQYFQKVNALPLSYSLPLQPAAFVYCSVKSFFAGQLRQMS